MKLYEINIHLSAHLEEKEIEKLWQELKKEISKNALKVLRELPLKKLKLAYPIKKQNYALNGSFLVETEMFDEEKLKKTLLQNENILRFLILRQKTVPLKFLEKSTSSPKVSNAPKKPVQAKKDIETKTVAKTKEKKVKKSKIKLEDIDKSLEKLLEKEL